MKKISRNTQKRPFSSRRRPTPNPKKAMLCVRISEQLHSDLKAKAASKYLTLSDYVIQMLEANSNLEEARRLHEEFSGIPDAYKIKKWSWAD